MELRKLGRMSDGEIGLKDRESVNATSPTELESASSFNIGIRPDISPGLKCSFTANWWPRALGARSSIQSVLF